VQRDKPKRKAMKKINRLFGDMIDLIEIMALALLIIINATDQKMSIEPDRSRTAPLADGPALTSQGEASQSVTKRKPLKKSPRNPTNFLGRGRGYV
jgi:hypothetical protein